jgi:hypothetical protein
VQYFRAKEKENDTKSWFSIRYFHYDCWRSN